MRWRVWGVVFVTGTMAVPAGAQTPAPAVPPAATPRAPTPFPASARIAVVNLQNVLSGSKLGQAGQQTLKTESDRWNGLLQGMITRLQGLREELTSQASTLTSAAYAQRKTAIDKLQLEVQFQQQQRDAELERLGQQLSAGFDEKVQPIIETLRGERNLWFVIDVSAFSVMAIHPGIDLSAEVITRLDAAN